MKQTIWWHWRQIFHMTINLDVYTHVSLIAYNILRKWNMKFEILKKTKFAINDVEIILFLLSINNWCFMINISWNYCYEFEKILFRTFVSINNRRFCNFFCIYFNFCIAYINSHDCTFFTSWRWIVIRNSEFQKRIFDTIQRVFEFSSRRKFYIRSIVIARRCFQWR